MYAIIIRYQDGRDHHHRDRPATIADAMSIALDTADALGHEWPSDDPDRPSAVEIWEGAEMHLSIAVFAGGLLSDAVPAA